MEPKYIVLEGGEGAGKTTQAKLLVKKLDAEGIRASYVQEPGSNGFGKKLRDLIKTSTTRTPRTNTLAFNAARAETMADIKTELDRGNWVVSDRSFLSTVVYQGYGEGEDLEEVRQISELAASIKPNLMIILDVDTEKSAQRLDFRGKPGDYFEDKDIKFHQKVRDGYLKEAENYQYPVVNGKLSKEAVSDDIWLEVEPLLSGKSSAGKKSKKSNPYINKIDGDYKVTAEGKKYLNGVLTNTESDVYVFNENISPVTVAAGMARLSRRSDDMRVTILDEFSAKKGKDEGLLKRVITAYGDDSVQQLVGLQAVVENASNLLTKKLEWGRLAAYLEQSTRYIYFDKKVNGKYRYYTPPEFDASTTKIYEETMNQIFNLYSDMVHRLTDYVRNKDETPESERDMAWKGATRAQACDAIREALPVATTSRVGIFASGQAYESLIMHLMADEMQESNLTGQKLLDEGRKVVPTFLERADNPERGGAKIAYMANTRKKMAELSEEMIPHHSTDYRQPVTLVDVSHQNELDLVPYMLYNQTSLSLNELIKETSSWSYHKKLKVFDGYMGERLNRRHKPGRALEHIEYHFDLVCDYGIFRDLQRHRMVEGLEWQNLTPRFGFETPKLVEEAGLSDIYEACFDFSLSLFTRLQTLGFYDQAQYAVLMGHKMRWKISYNARQAFHFHELRSTPQGHPGYRKLINQMHDKIAEVHPMIASAMKFVNQDEDPALSRLAAERYTQFKLQQLDN